LPKAIEERGKSKRFLQKERAWREWVFQEAFGIARHEKNLNVGLRFEDAAVKIRAAHAGHDHISDKNIDDAGMVFGDFHGVLWGKGVQHDEARLTEKLTDGVDQRYFVVDQQDGGRGSLAFDL
jgi:hypothetical protein